MGQDPERIVVGYDGSPDSELGLQWAVRTAERQHCEIAVIVVASGMDPVLSEYHEISERRAQEWRAQAEETLRTAGAGGTVEIQFGPAYPVLLKAVGPGDLLVVGSRGHGIAAGILVGSVSQHLVRLAPCPVVVARTGPEADAPPIVVGADGSLASDAALRWAAARAAATGERVVAVTACRSTSLMPGIGVPSEEEQTRLDVTFFRLRRQLAPIRRAFPDVDIAEQVTPGSAGRVLVEASKGGSLVVVGTRGRDPLAELVVGSTAQFVLTRAACPVAVVRQWPPAAEIPDAAASH